MKISSISYIFIALIITLITACGQQHESEKEAVISIVFKHGKIAGDLSFLITCWPDSNPLKMH